MSYIPTSDISMGAVNTLLDIILAPIKLENLYVRGLNYSKFSLRGLQTVETGETFTQFRSRILSSPFNLAEFAGYFNFLGMWHGYLYNGFVATDNRGLGPGNWRVPTFNELNFIALSGNFDSDTIAQGTIIDGEGMPRYTYEQTTEMGYYYTPKSLFAVPSGSRHHSAAVFVDMGLNGSIWTTTQHPDNSNNTFGLLYEINSSGVKKVVMGGFRRGDGRSIRLVNTDSTDVANWNPGDVLDYEGVKYNIGKFDRIGGSILIMLQNFRGSNFKNGDPIMYIAPNTTSNSWTDNPSSYPKMCSYEDDVNLAIKTAHY